MSNKLIVAAAGSGKTRLLVKKALELADEPVLITTYTEANEQEIINKFIKVNGCVPKNVTIQTWFSFLIKHGVKPYQSCLFDYKVKGLLLTNTQSGFRGRGRFGPIYWGEGDFDKYYFTSDHRIYSDKLSKLVCKLEEESQGKILQRLAKIFKHIFIDETQDLAGYDLSIINLLAISPINLIMVCDPRQVTYLTHHERKFAKYKNGLIEEYIKNECGTLGFTIDNTSLSKSYRCIKDICDFSNRLYPNFPTCESANQSQTDHDGLFLVKKEHIEEYIDKYNPVQLRWSSSIKGVSSKAPCHNFGQSKGLTFERVLIYPTADMINWIKDGNSKLGEEARAKFYVALTRANYSVGLVCEKYDDLVLNGIKPFKTEEN